MKFTQTGQHVTGNNFLDFHCFRAVMAHNTSIQIGKRFALFTVMVVYSSAVSLTCNGTRLVLRRVTCMFQLRVFAGVYTVNKWKGINVRISPINIEVENANKSDDDSIKQNALNTANIHATMATLAGKRIR